MYQFDVDFGDEDHIPPEIDLDPKWTWEQAAAFIQNPVEAILAMRHCPQCCSYLSSTYVGCGEGLGIDWHLICPSCTFEIAGHAPSTMLPKEDK